VKSLVFDSGAFIAAERFDRLITTYVKAAEMEEAQIYISAAVIAEVWRSPLPANFSKILGLGEVIALDETRAKQVGELLGRSGTSQVTDAAVAVLALEFAPSIVLSSDVADIERLVRVCKASRAGGAKSVIVKPV